MRQSDVRRDLIELVGVDGVDWVLLSAHSPLLNGEIYLRQWHDLNAKPHCFQLPAHNFVGEAAQLLALGVRRRVNWLFRGQIAESRFNLHRTRKPLPGALGKL